ncbi:MAG: ABC transporter ATP-binding protein [Sphaerochaeta sp.]
MANLTLSNLVKRFDDVVAVDHINLDVADGEFVTLLGPSGCGKTTTLRTIAGFYYPDEGEVLFGNTIMNNVPPNKRDTAMCFQSYALFPHMTVWDNISFGLKMRKVPVVEQKAKIERVMEMLSLKDLGNRKPGQLSGGQQQRVALARSIVTEPQVLLFDEPLSNLDAKLRVQVRVEIREMQKRLGITAIYVTHDQDEALAISDRIVIMSQGKIEQIGDPYTIYRHPKTRFVAGFIGMANIFDGVVLEKEGAVCTVQAPFGKVYIDTEGQEVPNKGDTIHFSWRPEDMKIRDRTSRNQISGNVVQAVFMGDITDLFIEVNGCRMRAQSDDEAKITAKDHLSFGISEKAFSILRG